MTPLICIECGARFENLDQARRHTNRPVSKDSTATYPLRKHVIFPAAPLTSKGGPAILPVTK